MSEVHGITPDPGKRTVRLVIDADQEDRVRHRLVRAGGTYLGS